MFLPGYADVQSLKWAYWVHWNDCLWSLGFQGLRLVQLTDQCLLGACCGLSGGVTFCMGTAASVWRSKAIIILQLRYNDILTVMSILKIVNSYLLFVMSKFISLCHNSEPLVHNSDRCFIIRTVMSIFYGARKDHNRLIYRRTMTTGLD
jgi:hypothetical protein